MTIQEQISKQIRDFRVKRELTQEQLADLAGVSASFINRIENGKETPSFQTIESLSKALRVSLVSLLTDTNKLKEKDNDIAKIEIAYNNLSPKQKQIALPLVISLFKTLKKT